MGYFPGSYWANNLLGYCRINFLKIIQTFSNYKALFYVKDDPYLDCQFQFV